MDIILEQVKSEKWKDQWETVFEAHQLYRPEAYYNDALRENAAGTRVTLLALFEGQLVGCAHLKYDSNYPHFKHGRIPEINDLVVFPEYRRRGIANKLIEAFERIVCPKYSRIGIGVGLYKDYGAAQRIYCRRGYIPDGNGVMYQDHEVRPGQAVPIDDELVLYLVKELCGTVSSAAGSQFDISSPLGKFNIS